MDLFKQSAGDDEGSGEEAETSEVSRCAVMLTWNVLLIDP